MNKTTISAQVVADSVDTRGNRLTSLLVTFPRFILAEVNTHRMLSKNTSSSRAIPFKKMVESVQDDPFIPIAFQKEHTGMQGSEYITDEKNLRRIKEDWLEARDIAIYSATQLNKGFNLKDEEGKYVMTKPELRVDRVTKQLCNRLLEPFMWTTMLITGSKEGWNNFFELRCPQYQDINTVRADGKGTYYKSKKEYEISANVSEYEDFVDFDWKEINKGQAEIHMMMLSEEIYDAVNESTPRQLKAGEWHIPFEDKIVQGYINSGESVDRTINKETLVKISTAMSARTSYTVVGEEKGIDYQKMIELHDRLIGQNPPHSSPMEHCCLCVSEEEYNNSFKGVEKGWFRNYRGFKSYREIIES